MKYFANLVQAQETEYLNREKTTFLDLGMGNGSMLFALHADGWNGEMLGVDYSPTSVALARRVQAARLSSNGCVDGTIISKIRFRVWDILSDEYSQEIYPLLDGQAAEPNWIEKGWDVVLDKGTFDAISLSGKVDSQGRRIMESYKQRIMPLVRNGGRFLLTSCNWTEDELLKWFAEPIHSNSSHCENGSVRFVFTGKVSYPRFIFGGTEGQTITTLCFKKSI